MADKFIDVFLCTDLITYEGPEIVELTLSNAQGGAVLGSQTSTTLTINDVGARFANNTQISITGGPASPYPSDINVAGVLGAISDVKVTLIGVTHTFPDDIDVLLRPELPDDVGRGRQSESDQPYFHLFGFGSEFHAECSGHSDRLRYL
jgi:hypothetical protein